MIVNCLRNAKAENNVIKFNSALMLQQVEFTNKKVVGTECKSIKRDLKEMHNP